jgi:hypothetical protein
MASSSPPPSATQVQTGSNDTSPRILSHYAYVVPSQIINGILQMIGEVIDESNQKARFVKVVAPSMTKIIRLSEPIIVTQN